MSEPPATPPEEQWDDPVEEEEVEEEPTLRTSLSLSPSILRPAGTPRNLLSEAPSVVISLPDVDIDSQDEETSEQRHRRRMRFLEMRREHYSQMHYYSEQCTMTDDEEQECASTCASTCRPAEKPEKEEDKKKEPK